MSARAAVLLAVLVGGCGAPEEVVVFAAASLTDVAHEAAARVQETGAPVRVSVGSTALLARQIERGAPADLFLAADPAWIEYVRQRTDTVIDVRDVATGHLVVVGPLGTPPAASVADAIRGERIAMGDPGHVPAGVYGRRALQRLGVWDDVRERVVPQADVRAALAAVESGATDRAVVYASDAAVSERVAVVYRFDAAATEPVVYRAALLSEEGRTVLNALTDSVGRASLARYGFGPAVR